MQQYDSRLCHYIDQRLQLRHAELCCAVPCCAGCAVLSALEHLSSMHQFGRFAVFAPCAVHMVSHKCRQHKLCLVLDLDHTLINSARFSEVDPEHEAMLRSHQANEALRLPEDRRELFRLDRIQMWTKLRPAVRQFLETAHEHFELWIHTNGNRLACAVCGSHQFEICIVGVDSSCALMVSMPCHEHIRPRMHIACTGRSSSHWGSWPSSCAFP